MKEEQKQIGNGVPMEEELQYNLIICAKFNKTDLSNPTLYMVEAMCNIIKKIHNENTFFMNYKN